MILWTTYVSAPPNSDPDKVGVNTLACAHKCISATMTCAQVCASLSNSFATLCTGVSAQRCSKVHPVVVLYRYWRRSWNWSHSPTHGHLAVHFSVWDTTRKDPFLVRTLEEKKEKEKEKKVSKTSLIKKDPRDRDPNCEGDGKASHLGCRSSMTAPSPVYLSRVCFEFMRGKGSSPRNRKWLMENDVSHVSLFVPISCAAIGAAASPLSCCCPEFSCTPRDSRKSNWSPEKLNDNLAAAGEDISLSSFFKTAWITFSRKLSSSESVHDLEDLCI